MKIKNYICHNCKVKYFTSKEKRTIYNMIHFFLFFLLGFLPFLSFCNKKQCRHTRIEQFLTKQHLYHFRTAQFLILGLHILYHDNTHRHVTTITQVVIRTEDCTGAKFYYLNTLNFTVPAITLNHTHTHCCFTHTAHSGSN